VGLSSRPPLPQSFSSSSSFSSSTSLHQQRLEPSFTLLLSRTCNALRRRTRRSASTIRAGTPDMTIGPAAADRPGARPSHRQQKGANQVESTKSDPPQVLIFPLYSSNSRRAASVVNLPIRMFKPASFPDPQIPSDRRQSRRRQPRIRIHHEPNAKHDSRLWRNFARLHRGQIPKAR
jgi:hypothetical protein